MGYTLATPEVLKARLEKACDTYEGYCKGERGRKDFYGPWEAFKIEIFDVITSDRVTQEVLEEVYRRLSVLAMNQVTRVYRTNSVMFELGFIYRALSEIVLRNREMFLVENIVDLCTSLRGKGFITHVTSERITNKYVALCEEQLFDTIIGTNTINSTIAHKIVSIAPLTFYQCVVERMEPSLLMISTYGHIFDNLYKKYPVVWPTMENIYQIVNGEAWGGFSSSDTTKLALEGAARSTDNTFMCIVGAMSNLVSQEALKKLSMHSKDVVRFATAFNESLNIETLECLARDKSDVVKWRAVNTLRQIANETGYSKRFKRAEAEEALKRLGISSYY